MRLSRKLFKLTKSSKKNSPPVRGILSSFGKGVFCWGTVLCALGIFVLGWYLLQHRYGFIQGEKSPATFVAVETMRYADSPSTTALRHSVSRKVAGVVVHDPQKIREFLDAVTAPPGRSHEAFFQLVDPEVMHLLGELPPEQRGEVLHEVHALGNLLLEKGILYSQTMGELLWEEMEGSSLSWSQQNLLAEILLGLFKKSQRKDPLLTRTLREYVGNTVEPVIRTLYRGDIIVEKGEIITPEHARLLSLQGYRESRFPWKYALFLGILAFAWALWFQKSIHFFEKSSLSRELLFSLCLLCCAWCGEIAARWFDVPGLGTLLLGGWGFLSLSFSRTLPFVLGGGCLGILVGGSPFFSRGNAPLLVVAVLAFGASLQLRNVTEKKTCWFRIFWTGALGALVIGGIQWGEGSVPDFVLLGRFLGGSALCGTLVLWGFPLWERLFGVLPPLRLAELSHPSSPLLKRLQTEAPGTFQHSLMVGSLAEQAAAAIGLDENLVKAGALYHDVGKLRRPHFFIENQQYGAANAHDSLSPTLSALVIISHVRDGYELCLEYDIPKKIRQFVLEHHGTTCLGYFQKKAEALGETVTRQQFTYPGPPPQSKETALVMLADSVEAAVRSDTKKVPRLSELEDVIHGVVENKIREKQLENVDFTFRELERVKKSFVEALRSIYHSREGIAKTLPEPGGKE